MHRPDAFGPVPPYSREGDGARSLSESEADMLILNKSRDRGDAHVLCGEGRFFIAHAERFEAAKPGKESGRNAVKRQVGVDGERTAKSVFREICKSIGLEMLAESGDARRGK